MCRKIALDAESWVAVPPVWPWLEIGTSPNPASRVTAASTLWLRTAKHSTVTPAAIRVVVSQACPFSVDVRYWPKMLADESSKVLISKRPTKVTNAVKPEATAQTPALAAATSSARPYSGRFESSAKQASTRPPSVPAAPRLNSSLLTGMPKRTIAPGSLSTASDGSAPPP